MTATAYNAWAIRDLIAQLQADHLSQQDVHQTIRDLTAELSENEADALLCDWEGIWARPEQLQPEGDWLFWMNCAGRGWGKTRVGAEAVRKWATDQRGSRGFIAARTIADARDTCVEGESGLLACLPTAERPPFGGDWNRSKGELWLGPSRDKGTYVKLFSSEEPDSARGFQAHWGWADELAAWLKDAELWDQLLFGLRLPWPERNARAVITTTPKPRKVMRELLKNDKCVVRRGTTYDNLFNLSPAFRQIIRKYEGTRLGRQELNAELLDDVPGALWTRQLLEEQRIRLPPLRLNGGGDEEFDFVRIVVAIDPAASSGEESDETGIVVAARGANGKRYVLEDGSMRGKPHEWAERAIDLYHRWKADRIVAEANNGGEMVESVIRAHDRDVPVKLVYASRGKHTRAEPISTAYERHDVFHVGMFELLEDQLCNWTPEEPKSPDRLDALVWALTELEGGTLVL